MGDDGIKDAYRTGPRHDPRAGPRTRSRTSRAAARRSCSPRCRSRRASTRSRASSPSSSRAGKVDGVRDIRNESGQGKTRLVIELRADANPQIVLNNLFKHTAAQSTFPVNMVALVDGVPRTINLQEALQAWLDHQVVVLTRRTQYRLEQGRSAAAHRRRAAEGARHDRRDREGDPRVEGPQPRRAPRSWATGSGSPRSRRTTSSTCRSAGSRSSVATSWPTRSKELDATIKELRRILAKRAVLMGVIREELIAIRDAHKAPRRTAIEADDTGTIDVVALVEDEPYVVTVTARGYVRAHAGAARDRRRSRTRASATRSRRSSRRPRSRACCSSPIAGARTARPCTTCRRSGSPPRRTCSSSATASGSSRSSTPARTRSTRTSCSSPRSGGVKRTALAEFAEASGRKDGLVAMKLAADDRDRRGVPGLGRVRAAARDRAGSGHPLPRGGGAAGRPQRRARSAASG